MRSDRRVVGVPLRGRAVLLLALAAACHRGADTPIAAEIAAGPPLEKTTEQGPLKATVVVQPKSPRLGDLIRLTLTVEAEDGVDVEMPPFGEALGRFEVVGFVPSERRGAHGTIHAQEYHLQAPMSGRQHLPPLRVEYVDRRPVAAPAAGTAPAPAAPTTPRSEELLTDEIALDVGAVDLAAGNQLAPARGRLELPASIRRRWIVVGGASAVGFALAFTFLTLRARRHALVARASAFEIASGRLHELEGRGLPGPEQADAWFVELSDIVRRYVEDRYGIRAPELTSEEFLREARRLGVLGDGQRDLLSSFLAGCDRVKYAGHEPEARESTDALGLARRFLDDTRPAPAAPAATEAVAA